MALVKKGNTTPEFESDDMNTIEAEAVDVTSDTPQAAEESTAEATPPVTATQVISTASMTSAVVLGSKFSAALQDQKYVLSLEDVRSIGLAAPRLTIDTGGFTKDGKDLGKSLTMQLISHNPRWIISPGIQGDEGKELVKYSYDGNFVDGDSISVRDYLTQLKNEGYDKASIKEYVDLWVVITGPDTDEASSLLGEMVVIQLSPQSAGQFKFFQAALGMKIAKGLAKPTENIKITVERVKMGSDNFGRATFSAA